MSSRLCGEIQMILVIPKLDFTFLDLTLDWALNQKQDPSHVAYLCFPVLTGGLCRLPVYGVLPAPGPDKVAGAGLCLCLRY